MSRWDKNKKVIFVEQVSCDFTKENFSAKSPDLSAPGADDVPEKEILR